MDEELFTLTMKCRKCRHILLRHPDHHILSAHGTHIQDNGNCSSLTQSPVWFLQEETFPEWVASAVQKENWTRGKLSCPFCQVRLGSFDFTSGSKCLCRNHVLPSVHIVKSKVDCVKSDFQNNVRSLAV